MAATFESFTDSGHDNASKDHTLSNSANRVILIFATREAIGAGVTFPTGATVGGNAAVQISTGLVSPDDTIKAGTSVWLYTVGAGESGVKTIAVTGGSGRPMFMAIELSSCSGDIQNVRTGGNDANLTLNNVEADSICIDNVIGDNRFVVNVDEGNTLIQKDLHNDGDDRFDYTWGCSRETGTGTIVMGWDILNTNRTYWMLEMGAASEEFVPRAAIFI